MFSVSACMTRINQILNNPAIMYRDVSHFFDQAISELNTSLRIQIPIVSEMLKAKGVNYLALDNKVIYKAPLTNFSIAADDNTKNVYWDTDEHAFRISATGSTYSTVYGVDVSGSYSNPAVYRAIHVTDSVNYWAEVPTSPEATVDLNAYLPDDWIIMFLIPYVCFNVAVRDGTDGELYREQYVQGFQQLQTSYAVPNTVILKDVAGTPAYTEIVKNNLNDLVKEVPVRAITENMMLKNATQAVFGGMNDRGGWWKGGWVY